MEKMIFHLFMLFITSGLWLVALAVVHFVCKLERIYCGEES